VVAFQIPGLEHVIYTKVDSGSLGIRMCVCVDDVAVLDEKTELGSESNEKAKSMLLHTGRICVLESVAHAHELLTIHTLPCFECSTSFLGVIPERGDYRAGGWDGIAG
jgi:hypothetical protein